jgi:hypothetical protein
MTLGRNGEGRERVEARRERTTEESERDKERGKRKDEC